MKCERRTKKKHSKKKIKILCTNVEKGLIFEEREEKITASIATIASIEYTHCVKNALQFSKNRIAFVRMSQRCIQSIQQNTHFIYNGAQEDYYSNMDNIFRYDDVLAYTPNFHTHNPSFSSRLYFLEAKYMHAPRAYYWRIFQFFTLLVACVLRSIPYHATLTQKHAPQLTQ